MKIRLIHNDTRVFEGEIGYRLRTPDVLVYEGRFYKAWKTRTELTEYRSCVGLDLDRPGELACYCDDSPRSGAECPWCGGADRSSSMGMTARRHYDPALPGYAEGKVLEMRAYAARAERPPPVSSLDGLPVQPALVPMTKAEAEREADLWAGVVARAGR